MQEGYQAALECNGVDLDGQVLKVDRCKSSVVKKVKAQSGSMQGAGAAADARKTEVCGALVCEACDKDVALCCHHSHAALSDLQSTISLQFMRAAQLHFILCQSTHLMQTSTSFACAGLQRCLRWQHRV